MKNYFLLLVIVFSLSLIAYAETTIIVKDTVKPDIRATFNETVVLLKANLTYVQSQQRIELTNRTTDNKTFMFTPKQALNNGFYYFIVEARDRIGNFKEFKENVIILVNETNIFFVDPKLGVSPKSKYNITFGTSLQANCSWSLFSDTEFEDGEQFSEKNSLTHKLSNFQPPVAVDIDQAEDSLRVLYLKCNDKNGRQVDEQLETGFDTSRPVIEKITPNENPVVKLPNPQTTLSVETNDKSVCFISGEGFVNKIFSNQNQDDSDTYEFNSKFTINYTPDPSANRIYTYSIFCRNRAQQDSSTVAQNIEVKISPFLTITVNYPKNFVGSNHPSYDISTNKNATCTARLGTNTIALQKIERGYRHIGSDSTQTLVEGPEYDILFTCSAPPADVKTESKKFKVDLTPPTNLSVTAAACKTDIATFEFSARDNQSGIIGYNYSVTYGSKSIVNWTYANGGSPLKTEKTGLKLNKTAVYTINVLAQNGAGAFSIGRTASFTYNPNATICLEKIPPIITFRVNDSSFGYKSVKVICTDSGTGCKNNTIRYGTSDNKTTCSPLSYGDTKILTSSSWFCAEALDNAGNKGNKTQFISLDAGAASCFNDVRDGAETDLNCGGSCPTCPVGKSCKLNTDCDTNACNPTTNKCEITSCTDSKKNGFESDVDCGGNSCNRCVLSKSCAKNADCVSNFCDVLPGQSSGICAATLCTDGIRNGFESDVDCGGNSCDKCPQGKSCSSNSDCSTGSCSFGSCIGTSAVPEFEGPEVSHVYSYSLLILGLLILITGLLFMYYLKLEPSTSITFIAIGGIAVLLALLDILLFTLPKPIIAVISILVLAGTGYFAYKNQAVIIQKITKKPITIQGRQAQGKQMQGEVPSLPTKEVRPVTREELEATKTMIEMLKKQKAEREMKRESMFKEFGKSEGKTTLIRPKELRSIEKITTKPKEIKIQKSKTEFERLGELKSRPVSELEKFSGREGSFDKLTKFAKGKYEDVFGKLPKSEKGFEGLSELEKKRLLKKIKKIQK